MKKTRQVHLSKKMQIVLAIISSMTFMTSALYLYGLNLPGGHRETIAVELDSDRETVWKVITRYEDFPSWWPEVTSTEKITQDGKEVWYQTDRHGNKIPYITAIEVPPSILVRKIATEGLSFGGVWIFELTSSQDKTLLTLTEDGFIRPVLLRAFAKLFMNKKAMVQNFTDSLQKKLSSQPRFHSD